MRRNIRNLNILFLCDDNATRSQIAEAAAKHLSPPRVRIFSAGVKPTSIPSQVHKVMAEIGISLNGQACKAIDCVPIGEIDLMVSFGAAATKCGPLPEKIKVEHWPISADRPPAETPATLADFRRERDEIDKRVFALFMDYWRNVA